MTDRVAHVDGKVIFIDEALPAKKWSLFIPKPQGLCGRQGRQLLSRAVDRLMRCARITACAAVAVFSMSNRLRKSESTGFAVDQFSASARLNPELWQPLEGPHWGYRRRRGWALNM